MTVLLMIGMIQVFIWGGVDQVKQIDRHERMLLHDCGHDGQCPLEQLSPVFFQEDGYGDLIPGDFVYGEQDFNFSEYEH